MPFGISKTKKTKDTSTPTHSDKPAHELRKELEQLAKHAEEKNPRETLVIEFFDILLIYADKQRASDLHIEPLPKKGVVRLRIDGILHDDIEIPPLFHIHLISRLKILTRMRTDEHRAPQDGRLSFATEKGEVDVRASVLPTIYGEKAVLRLLSGESHALSLEQLGFAEKDLVRIRESLQKPWGMILSTGPTGSGKTTSIYALLQEIYSRDINISTIEDPVEFKMGGVNQSQVDTKAQFTFADGLRALLRQDPDVIMVGEIRDKETAQIAVNASLTGHKMFSTLHTNDSATTIPRIIDIGVEPFLVASTLNCAVAQRLMRRVCESCAKDETIQKKEAEKIFSEESIKTLFGDKSSIKIKKAVGCKSCSSTGYKGRVGIFEVLVNTPTIEKMIVDRADATAIKAQAIKEGMTVMEIDGINKVKEGLSTIEEFLRILQD